MGTNFYINKRGGTSYDKHIGKRSAAGLYCWDCGVTLCKAGNDGIHEGGAWHTACPLCGKKPAEESFTTGAAGRELGFNKSKPKRKTGVASCSSFTWALDPVTLDQRLGKRKVVDEYGRKFFLKEFRDILKECPVQFTDAIGQEFS